jgi:hypothetical protein
MKPLSKISRNQIPFDRIQKYDFAEVKRDVISSVDETLAAAKPAVS